MAFAIAGDSGGVSSSCGRSLVLADAGFILQIKRKSLGERLKQKDAIARQVYLTKPEYLQVYHTSAADHFHGAVSVRSKKGSL